jgi:hypothetical protein
MATVLRHKALLVWLAKLAAKNGNGPGKAGR